MILPVAIRLTSSGMIIKMRTAAMSLLRYRSLPERYRRSPKSPLIDASIAEFSTQAWACGYSMNTLDSLWKRLWKR